MAVDDAARRNGARGQPLQNVGVVDGQRVPGVNGRHKCSANLIRKKRWAIAGRVEVDGLCQSKGRVEGHKLKVSVVDVKAVVALAEIYVLAQLRKIYGPQLLASKSMPYVDVGIRLEVQIETGLIQPRQAISFVVPFLRME